MSSFRGRRGFGDARTLDGCCGGFEDKDDLLLRSRSLRSDGGRRLLSKLAEYSSPFESIGSCPPSIISAVGIHVKSSSRRVELSSRLLGVSVR